MAGKVTPMLAQYLEIKGQHPDAVLLFRMGDFYETFFDDAKTLSEVAGVTLTSRDARSEHPVPLAGVPYHAIDTYLGRLLSAGLTVAICEQVEDPAQAKGLVKREIVEIISPGTATSPELVAGAAGHYCLSFFPTRDAGAGWALLDASTGQFRCGQEDVSLASLCSRHPIREVIVSEDGDDQQFAIWQKALPEQVINRVSSAWFNPAFAAQTLKDHFQIAGLTAFGLEEEGREGAVAAAGALLRYLSSLTLSRPQQVTTLRFSSRSDRMQLDEETLRNLEIFHTFRGERGEGTLIHHIDHTTTAMGHRLLELRLAEPLTDLARLEKWHSGVAALVDTRQWRQDLRACLQRIGDLDRLAARAASGRIGPAQLRQLGLSLVAVNETADTALADARHGHPVCGWAEGIPELAPIARQILDSLPDDPPALVRKGGYIREGVDPELDRCRSVASDTKGFLAGLQASERERTGIPTLKVGFNKVFGYYFEITRKHLDKIPDDYVQKQTLVNASRFHTEPLKEAESTILEAEEKAQQIENTLYTELLTRVTDHLGDIHGAAAAIARIDLMASFAELAEQRGYCCPVCDDSLTLSIEQGRHPVIECLLDHDFIPNDTAFDGRQRQILLMTGPNMGGKSTYLRQVGLITLLAQAGSFVPATAAHIGLADRIFTRVGASDNLARGESTFFSEMSETAHILHQMSRRSLVILDEIGRGTSTYDGLSLAWAITEFLHSQSGPRPRSLFATHYHELTELEESQDGLVNLQLDVKEWEGKIIFMHRVKPGCSDKSYGIHVARLAGIPEPVLRRAKTILEQLSLADQRALSSENAGPGKGASLAADEDLAGGIEAGLDNQQLSLFNEIERDALEALKSIDLDRISPVDAFMWLVKIKKQLKG